MDQSTAYPVSQTRHQSNTRQGLCHISQLLEMLFLKYGISTEELELANAGETQAAQRTTGRSARTPAASGGRAPNVAASCEPATSVIATASLAATSSETAQATFDWFQPSELTI